MATKENAYSTLIVQAVSSLQSVDASISDDSIERGLTNPDAIVAKLNELSGTLIQLADAANQMNELALHEIPTEVLSFVDVLDREAKTPSHFEIQYFKDCEASATSLADRMVFVSVRSLCALWHCTVADCRLSSDCRSFIRS